MKTRIPAIYFFTARFIRKRMDELVTFFLKIIKLNAENQEQHFASIASFCYTVIIVKIALLIGWIQPSTKTFEVNCKIVLNQLIKNT